MPGLHSLTTGPPLTVLSNKMHPIAIRRQETWVNDTLCDGSIWVLDRYLATVGVRHVCVFFFSGQVTPRWLAN